MAQKTPGQIGWLDLTVSDADTIRGFYESVVGWRATNIDMGDYADYAMVPTGMQDAVAGICHARGGNSGMPPVWLPYFIVEDADKSLADALQRGATQLKELVNFGDAGKWCVLRDPAGAPFALFQSPKPADGKSA